MAKATKIEPVQPAARLDLDGAEAQTLFDILCLIAGDPSNSRRRFADSIRVALYEIGLRHQSSDINGGVRFITS